MDRSRPGAKGSGCAVASGSHLPVCTTVDVTTPDDKRKGRCGMVGEARSASGGRTLLPTYYAALTAVSVLPLALVRVPVLGDYLNHLARIHVLLTASRSATLQIYYDPAWHFAPYLGMDLAIAGLAQVMPLLAAGRAFAAVCIVLPVLAAAVLRRTLRGHAGLAPALLFPVGCGYLLAAGFLNFVFAACLGMLLFAAWLRQRAGRLAPGYVVLFGVGAACLYAAHALAFLCYAVVLGAWEAINAIRSDLPVSRRIIRFSQAAITGLPALALILFVPGSTGAMVAAPTAYGSVAQHLVGLVLPYVFSASPVLLPLLASAAGAAATVLFLFRAEGPARPLLVTVLVAAMAVPHVLMGVVNADFRLPFLLAVLGAASLCTAWHRPLPGRVAAALLSACVLARSVELGLALRTGDRQAASLISLLEALPRGSKLLVADVSADGAGAGVLAGHLPLLAVVTRDALVPALFAYGTPLELRPAFRDHGSINAGAVPLAELMPDSVTRPADATRGFGWRGQRYWLGWRRKYDALLITHRAGVGYAAPSGVRRVASAAEADLYLIEADVGSH